MKQSQKVNEKKHEIEPKKKAVPKGMSELDEFNLNLLKRGCEVQNDSGMGKNLPQLRVMRPMKSDHEQIARTLGENSKYPRDRTYAIRNMNKFDGLRSMLEKDSDRNIFKKVH